MTKHKTLLAIAFGSLLIAGGLVLFALPAIVRQVRVSEVATPAESVVTVKKAVLEPQAVTGHPVRLSIPSLGIDLPVIDGLYDARSRNWTLTTNKVQFATMTNEPNNDNGLTFMYGHARKEVFARLPKITAGAEALITTSNGKTFKYMFSSSTVVKPTESGFLEYEGAPILVLQTCTGTFYQNRQLFTFTFEGVA